MPLTPQAKTLVDLVSAGFPALGTGVLDAAEARRILAALPAPRVEPVPVRRVEDRAVPGPAGAPEVPVRIYWPEGSVPESNSLPAVVFCHGGGFVICDLDSHDQLCRTLSNGTGAIVVSVGYRRAPEDRFPAAAEDAYAALRWTAEHAGELGADAARIAVAGDSAGGNLAAVLALLSRDRGGPALVAQLLIYPMLDPRRDTASHRENAQGYFVTADHLRWYWEQYLGAGEQLSFKDPYAAPVFAEDLSGLPPAHIVTAEFDPLRDEGEAYGERLRAAGVPTTVLRYDGVFHGFFTMAAGLPEASAAQGAAFAALRRELGTAPRVLRVSPALPADDLGSAVSLLGAALGCEATFVDGDRWAQFDVGSERVSLAGSDRASELPTLMVKVSDLDAAIQSLRAAGHEVAEPVTGPHERRALVAPTSTEARWALVLYAPLG